MFTCFPDKDIHCEHDLSEATTINECTSALVSVWSKSF